MLFKKKESQWETEELHCQFPWKCWHEAYYFCCKTQLQLEIEETTAIPRDVYNATLGRVAEMQWTILVINCKSKKREQHTVTSIQGTSSVFTGRFFSKAFLNPNKSYLTKKTNTKTMAYHLQRKSAGPSLGCELWQSRQVDGPAWGALWFYSLGFWLVLHWFCS